MKIIHLSDFHISSPFPVSKQWWRELPLPFGRFSSLLSELVSIYLDYRHLSLTKGAMALGLLVKEIEEKYQDSWVVITGDLTDKGEEEEYKLVRELLEPFIHRKRMIVLPGNHEYPLLPALSLDGMKNFSKYFGDCSGKDYPILRELSHNLVLIGLNSAHDIPRLSGTGSVGPEQLARLDRLLSSKSLRNKVKILALHHDPFNRNFFTELNDREELLEIIKGRVDIVLCGHKHNSYIKRRCKGIRVICSAPSSVLPDEQGLIHFRSFEVKGNNQIRLGHHRLNLDKAIAKISSLEKLHK